MIISKKDKPLTLCNAKTDWNLFRDSLNNQITCKIHLKTRKEIETAIDIFTTIVQKAPWESTPEERNFENIMHCPTNIKIKIAEKSKLRKEWQKSRSPHDKAKFNKAAKQLTKIINKEQNKAMKNSSQTSHPRKPQIICYGKLQKK